MDNLTHSLVGLFLARAGFRRATPSGTAILVLAANAPDFDVVSWFGGSASYIHWHRHITHSIMAFPFMALLTVAIVRFARSRAAGPKIRWLPAFLIAMLGVASHVLLDLTNVYGVRLLLPFSGEWFHWDLTPVVDLVIWAVLLTGLAAPAFGRLVGAEIGEREKSAGGSGWAITALLLLAAYDYGRSVLHDRALAMMAGHTWNGLSARRTAAFPEMNPLVWNGVAELSNAWVMTPVDLRDNFRTESGATFYKPDPTSAMAAAAQTEPFGKFMEFAQYPVWALDPSPGLEHATRVRLVDLRFGTPQAPGFVATATVNDGNQVIDAGFSFGTPRPR